MLDAALRMMFLHRWSGHTYLASPQGVEGALRVHRSYTDYGKFYDIAWSIRDERQTGRTLKPFFYEERLSPANLEHEVERVERDTIRPKIEEMLSKM